MKPQYTFICVGPDSAEVLYRTEDERWRDALAEYIQQDWEGRKAEYEGFKNARGVIVTKFDEPVFAVASARADARRGGIAPKPVESGQRFATLTALAFRLGVTTAAIGQALKGAAGEPATLRGVSFQYLEDYTNALSQDVRD